MQRTLVIAVVVAAALSSAFTVAALRITDPPSAEAQGGDVRYLRSIDRRLADVQRTLGRPTAGSLQDDLDSLRRAVASTRNDGSLTDVSDQGYDDLYRMLTEICTRLGERPLSCPSSVR